VIILLLCTEGEQPEECDDAAFLCAEGEQMEGYD